MLSYARSARVKTRLKGLVCFDLLLSTPFNVPPPLTPFACQHICLCSPLVARSNFPSLKRTNMSNPSLKALIVILGLDNIWDDTHPLAHHFLTTHPTRTVVREVKNHTQAHRYLNSTARPHAIVVTDAAVLKPDHRVLLRKLVHYARDGGTVIFDGGFAQRIGPAKLGLMFVDEWRVPWRAYEECSAETSLSTFVNMSANDGKINAAGLVKKYSTRANWIQAVALDDALHLDSRVASQLAAGKRRDKKSWRPPQGETYKTPYAFTVVGRGRLGYVGDVLYDKRSVRLIAAMCLYPGSRSHRALGTGVPDPSRPVENKGPVEGARRPREFQVTLRCVERATAQARVRKFAEQSKDKANELFRRGGWLLAAQMYRASAAMGAPEPTYLSNLAAALLKLNLWEHAESAASRALLHDPKHIKALYRRALARRELGLVCAAMSDISRLLAIEPNNAPALAEQQILQTIQATVTGESTPRPDSGSRKRPARSKQLEAEDLALDLEYPSDTDDYAHEGNGIACRYHNRAARGCRYGPSECMFRHAPDWKSVRDTLGRNVCAYWLVGECGKADLGTCVYAHDGTYLPRDGWWKDTGRLDRLRAEFDDAVKAAPLDLGAGRVKESITAEALIPTPYMLDTWVWADFDSEARAASGAPNEEDKVNSEEDDDGSDSDGDLPPLGSHPDDLDLVTYARLMEAVADDVGMSEEEKELMLLSSVERRLGW